jgi:hypothetical protein
MRMKDWATERERYALKRYYPGSFAFALKPEMAAGEPSHRLCANCYENGQKSILQQTGNMNRFPVVACARCKFQGPLSREEMPDA